MADKQNSSNFNFNWIFIKRFFKLLTIMFPRLRSFSTLLFFNLIFVLIVEQLLVFNVGIIASGYFKILPEKDKQGFISHTIKSLAFVCAVAFIKSINSYICSLLYTTWRRLVTLKLTSLYFRNLNYYHLTITPGSPDNPDQRISQDTDKMCLDFSKIFAQMVVCPFTIAYYIWETWKRTGYLGPIIVIGLFILSTILNKFLMSPVVNYVYQTEKLEGHFRFSLVQTRVRAESIAFYRSGQTERDKNTKKLRELIEVQNNLYFKRIFLNISINGSDYVGSIISYLILGIPIIAGYNGDESANTAPQISAASFVIMYLINQFTKLIDLAENAAHVAGNAHRVAEFLEHLCKLETKPVSHSSNYLGNNSIEFHQATLAIPNSERLLIKDFNTNLPAQANIIITGDSGRGKTSVLRCIAGLWSLRYGSIRCRYPCGHRGMLFLPQKPFFTEGTLRDQIVYPITKSLNQVDKDIIYYLELLDLGNLLQKCSGLDNHLEQSDWYDKLSPGESQRLSFVRLFFHKPPLALLDEATSQIGEDAEKIIYELCIEKGINFISVGHRKSLYQYHDIRLHVEKDGKVTEEDLS